MGAMEYRELETGSRMPMLGFGTYPMRGDEAENAVVHALSVGYRHIDTAAMYGNEDTVDRMVSGGAGESAVRSAALRDRIGP